MKLLFPIFFLLIFSFFVYSQNKNDLAARSLLDSVKTIYGDTCDIGVSSSLIKRLYKYKSLNEVKVYLSQYEKIRDKILEFRKNYRSTIENESAMLLDLDRVFHNQKQDNIINTCGLYFGPDDVTNLAVTYTIVRNSVRNFYLRILQLANFDQSFKRELTEYGDDWFISIKLKELKGVPFPLPAHLK
jgi:hypothetical protein